MDRSHTPMLGLIQHMDGLTGGPASKRIQRVFVGLWRSWERASMAWKRSSVRSRPGPPNNPPQNQAYAGSGRAPFLSTDCTSIKSSKGFIMSTVTQFRCEICGTESSNPIHWFMIECNADELRVFKWNPEVASRARHYCGEAHAGVYVSRWLASACSPSMPDFTRPSGS